MDILLMSGSLAGLACYVVWYIGTQNDINKWPRRKRNYV
jgi:hypothetical protein